MRWTSAPSASANCGRRAGRSCPAPRTRTRSPAPSAAARTARSAFAARLDQGARDIVHRVGQRVQRGGRHRQLLGQRAGQAAADADLEPVRADVLPPGQAAAAAARSRASCRR